MKNFFLLIILSGITGCLSGLGLEIKAVKKKLSDDNNFIKFTVVPDVDLVGLALKSDALIFVDSSFCDKKYKSIPADNDLYFYGVEKKVNKFIISNRNNENLNYENKYDVKISIEGKYHPNVDLDNFNLRDNPRDICIKLIVTRKLDSVESNEIVLTKEEIISVLNKK